MRRAGWAFGMVMAAVLTACGGEGDGEMCVPADPAVYDGHCDQAQVDAVALCEAIPSCTTVSCRVSEARCRAEAYARATECSACAGCWNAEQQQSCRAECETEHATCLENGGATCIEIRNECALRCGGWDLTSCAEQFPVR